MDRIPHLFEKVIIPAIQKDVFVTLVDNGSSDELINYLLSFTDVDNLQIIINSKNMGVARGRNIGFKTCTRPYIVYLDDDSMIGMDDLYKIPDIFEKHPEAGILAFRVLYGDSNNSQNEHGNDSIQVANYHGAGHAIRKTLFDEIGYLDEQCFFGAEELEYSMRALSMDKKTIYIPDIIIRHYSLQHKGSVGFKRRYFWARNYAMVLFRYLPIVLAFLFSFRLMISYLWSGFKDRQHISFLILPAGMIKGALIGIITKRTLSVQGIQFYSNPATRPEIGNISLFKKIISS